MNAFHGARRRPLRRQIERRRGRRVGELEGRPSEAASGSSQGGQFAAVAWDSLLIRVGV